MPLGTSELLIILVIVVVVFGATKLPQLGDGLGKAIRNFKRSVGNPEELEVKAKSEIKAAAESATSAAKTTESADHKG